MRVLRSRSRRTIGRSLLLALALVLASACADRTPPPYDESADARADLNRALQRAHAENKSVLVVFGANWCSDCRALAKKMAQGPVAEHVSQRYIVTKVDVGRFNKNTDLSQQMGDVIKQGIPAVAVLAHDGTVQGARRAGELSSASKMGDSKVLKVFDALASGGKAK